MDMRHEWKHEISPVDMQILTSRLSVAMQPDSHAVNGFYEIRSLYFDNLQDKALQEKCNGVSRREKFRLRYYNADTSYILLEKKWKINGLCGKAQARLTFDQAEALSRGQQIDSSDPLIQELCRKMVTDGLRPKTIVDYTRRPFVFPAGNVRVTIDYNIRTALHRTDFLNPHCLTIPAAYAPIILEVKWNHFLPNMIRDLVQLDGRQTSSFSKYASCRMYD